MNDWTYTDSTNLVAQRTSTNGSEVILESCLASTLPSGSTILPFEQSPQAFEGRVIENVQAILDDFARTRTYDDAKSAVGYAGDEDPQFNLEGTYVKSMRSRYWRLCYSIMGQVQAGLRPLPTLEEVINELPPLVWPTLSAS